MNDTITPTEIVLEVLVLDEHSCDPCRTTTASIDPSLPHSPSRCATPAAR